MKILRKILKWIGIVILSIVIAFLILLVIPEPVTVNPIKPRENTQYWEMDEGFKIAYTHLKSPSNSNSKPPIIFLHGGPGGYIHSSIIQTMKDLNPLGYDVYLYDQRGSGLSDRMDKYSDVSFQKHLLDLNEIVEKKIGASKVILIGQSFGSVIIAHYAAIHPNNIEKLVLSSPGQLRPYLQIENNFVKIDSVYPTPDSLQFKEPYNFIKDVDNMALKPKAIVATMGALLFDKKLISDQQMDRMLNTLASQFTKGMVCNPEKVLPEEGGGGLYAYFATNSDEYPEIRGKLKRIDAPVLVLQGQCEYHSFGVAYEYVDFLPNSHYRFIENAGHIIWWEQKEEYIETIKRFLLSN
ncbi:MAG: alpha/beta hydrolase [Flavobacteriaceae bacterium]|nr:alpha/beta hydrolase [Flavobacteriaceae bacterium]